MAGNLCRCGTYTRIRDGDQEGRGRARRDAPGSVVIPRRAFLRGLNLAVGGLAVGYCFPAAAQKPTNEPGEPPGPKPRRGSQAVEANAPG